MANSSDVLLSKLESISWMYSIYCQINGRDETLLIKYIIEEDFYAVMVTDLTQTYFECLDGKDIDNHYRRFNKGEIKRERLIANLKTLLSDVTKANEWHFETLVVDCHTSRLTLKVKNQISILKFEWSFYMISTNPETLSRHLTLPLLLLVSSLKHGIDVLRKEIKTKDKQLEQLDDNNSKTDTLSEESLINKMISYQKNISAGTDDNSVLINHLISDKIIHSVLKNAQNFENSSDICDKTTNNSQINVKQLDQNQNQGQMSQKPETDSQPTPPEVRRKSPTRQSSKKLKL